MIKDNPEVLYFWEEFRTWQCFKALPNGGGIGVEDAKLIKALEFINLEINKIENDKAYSKWRSEKNRTPNKDENKQINSFRDIKSRR
jgi:hypothetical protein